jgi:hypothetical protein
VHAGAAATLLATHRRETRGASVLSDHPFLDVLWTAFLLFLWVGWIALVVMVLIDLFRRDDFSGGRKALWALLIVVVPWLGVLIYLTMEGGGMSERRLDAVDAAQARKYEASQRAAATSDASSGAAAEIERGRALLEAGTITPAEFEKLKQRALG